MEDPTNAKFLASAIAIELLHAAYHPQRLDGYTLWTCETCTDALAGWMMLADDDGGCA